MRIAVTGRDGQVARALAEVGAREGVTIIPVGRPDLDLAAPQSILPALQAASADVVVNAAAYTAVDKAESEPDLAYAVNAAGAGAVAAAAADLGLPVLHLSTDYVFDGTCARPYREDDATGPLGVYGSSKLAGEHRVAAANPRHVILRTAWVYAPFGSNFVRTMLRLAATRNEVGVVADQQGCPTSALDIARTLVAIARRVQPSQFGDVDAMALAGAAMAGAALATPMSPDRDTDPELYGTFHMTGQGEAVWADVAEAIFACSAGLGGPVAHVRRIATAEYPTPARRPANSRLNGEKLARRYGILLPQWRESVDTCVTRLLAPAADPA